MKVNSNGKCPSHAVGLERARERANEHALAHIGGPAEKGKPEGAGKPETVGLSRAQEVANSHAQSILGSLNAVG